MHLMEKTPAERFEDAYLLGNGELGISQYGGVPTEELLINVDSLWSGQERENANPRYHEAFERARDLALRGEYKQANNVVNNEMDGHWSEAYLPLGSLYLTVGQRDNRRNMPLRRVLLMDEDPFIHYERSLKLDTAIAEVHYERGGVRYRREVFVSHPAHAAFVRLTAEGGSLDFAMSLDSPLRHLFRAEGTRVCLWGTAPDHAEPSYTQVKPTLVYHEKSNAIRFAACAAVRCTDGKIECDGDRVYVHDASYAVLAVAADTNYAGYRQPRDQNEMNILHKLEARTDGDASFEMLRDAHVQDYKKLYDRVQVRLGQPISENVPTSELLSSGLEAAALAVQYARYLLIAGSRAGTQPLNLQGLWNDSVSAPWAANYTLNINTEMNYWPAEAWALADCTEPLQRLTQELADAGRATADECYNAPGWVTHHNTDLWRETSPSCEDATWSYWPMAGFWLCHHLYEHWLYGGDCEALERVYPVLLQAARFGMGLLTEDDGQLLTAPSVSPENKYRLTDAGTHSATQKDPHRRLSSNAPDLTAITKGSAMDLTLLTEIFHETLEAAHTLHHTDQVLDDIRNALKRLAPLTIGKSGLLCEWHGDAEECMPGMGHMSHLYGVYPGCVINRSTPELSAAARHSLHSRILHGGLRGGWPCAWGIALSARFGDAYLCAELCDGIGRNLSANLLTQGSTQIDCVLGWAGAVAEMLLQSHENVLRLLPALPLSWREGSISGLRARGGFSLDMMWSDGCLQNCTVYSLLGRELRVSAEGLQGCTLPNVGVISAINGVLTIPTKKDACYQLNFNA